MTAAELAAMLDGREIGTEISRTESSVAKDAGLVVVYGYSDDNVEFAGAVDDEVGTYEGGTIHLTSTGVLQEPDCGHDDCPYFAKERDKAAVIEAVWHNSSGPCWTFETDIPHETFTIVEDGDPWCVGIVFSIEHLRAKV